MRVKPSAGAVILLAVAAKALSPSSSATLPGEKVIQSQLSALREEDLYGVFQYASPSNKAVTGPWDRFAQMVRSEPYAPLIGHESSEILMLVNPSSSSLTCLVRIWPRSNKTNNKAGDGACSLDFWWQVSLCEQEGPFAGCWMVDGVMPSSFN